MQPSPANLYEFGAFQLDPAKRLLRRLDGTAVPLTSRVFETLLFMVEHHDAVLDKERIMEAVWPDSIVEENNLAQAISKLRQVFGETPGSHSYIVTVPGRGYRFVAEVRERTATPATPESPSAAMQPLPAASDTGLGTPFPRRQPKSPLISQSQRHLEVSRSSDPEGFWGCPRQLPGCGRLPSQQLLSFASQPYFLSAIAVCPRVCGRPVRLSRSEQFYLRWRRSPKRASQCCRLIILATISKTRISPSACRMKSLRTLRELPTSRLSVVLRRIFTKAEIRATRVRSDSNWAWPIF